MSYKAASLVTNCLISDMLIKLTKGKVYVRVFVSTVGGSAADSGAEYEESVHLGCHALISDRAGVTRDLTCVRPAHNHYATPTY